MTETFVEIYHHLGLLIWKISASCSTQNGAAVIATYRSALTLRALPTQLLGIWMWSISHTVGAMSTI